MMNHKVVMNAVFHDRQKHVCKMLWMVYGCLSFASGGSHMLSEVSVQLESGRLSSNATMPVTSYVKVASLQLAGCPWLADEVQCMC